MPKQIGLTGVALAVLLLAMTPAAAVSINLGGGGGGLLGGGSGDSGASVTVGGDNGSVLDLGGSDTDADVNLGLGNTTGTGNGLIDLGNDGDDDAVEVDLFGRPGTTAPNSVATVDLGGDNNDDVILDLFGRSGGGGDTANAAINLGGSNGLAGTGGSNDVTLDLFGGDDVDNTQTGSTTPPAGGGGSGNGGGNGGSGVFAPANPAAPGGTNVRPGATAGARVATTNITGGTGNCFAPDQGQIGNLLGRTSYSAAMTSEWKAADEVKLVPINLCASARTQLDAALAADDNIGFLHAAVAADPDITAALSPGYAPANVLAVDQSGDDLTVYVY